MKLKFDVSVQEYALVHEILARHLPQSVRVWVFGSRAKRTAGFNSDLDLALEGDGVLPARTVAEIGAAFTESRLPYRVDVLDLNAIGDDFRAHIQARAVPFPRHDPGRPALRFRDAHGQPFPDWELRRLGELGIFKSGVGFPEAEQNGRHGIPFYKVSDMNLVGNEFNMTTANNFVTEEQVRRLKLKPIIEYSIIFAKVGAAIFLERKRQASNFLLDNNMMAFIPNQKIADEYLGHLFSGLRLSRFAQVGALPSYNGSDLATIKLPLPSLPEQRKIASFLSAVDRRIAALERRRALLTQYKRGLMQKLFSQELRFRDDDGHHFPDWELRRLGEVFVERSERNNSEAELLAVSLNYGVVRASEFDRKASSNNDRSNYKAVKIGDIAYNSMRMWQGASGCSHLNGIVSPAYTVITPNAGQITEFYAHYFKARKTIFLFQRYSQGLTSDTWNLKFPAFADIKLPLPSPPEQRKIASFLSAVDRRIAATANQVEGWKTWKRGLMQGLFPRGSEAPGPSDADK